MKIDRIAFLTLAGLPNLIGTPTEANMPEIVDTTGSVVFDFLEQHPLSVLFSGEQLPGAVWTHSPVITYDISQEALQDASAEGIDILVEVQAAVRGEVICDAEQAWLRGLRDGCETIGVDFSDNGSNADQYIDAVFAGMPANANTLITTPMGITGLGIANSGRFVRTEGLPYISNVHLYGVLDSRLTVLVDSFADETTPSLVGFLEPLSANRKAALVRVGLTDYEFGYIPDYNFSNDWRKVEADHAKMFG